MVEDRSQKRLPLYVSYRTFQNFVEGLQPAIPSRIDRSYWGDRFSGSTGTQLMSALRFLGLVDANDVPTNRLKQLVSARGERKTEVLREITREAFSFLLQGSFDPQTATYSQLQEIFSHTFQLTGDVSRKCIKFFVAIATDAGVPLSPFITQRRRTAQKSTGTKTTTKRVGTRTNQTWLVPQELKPVPRQDSWDEMVLAKFPAFDPAWSEEVKLKWFDAYDELLKRGPARVVN